MGNLKDKERRVVMNKIYYILNKIPTREVICILEQIKLDYMINGGMVILDGKVQTKLKK